MNASNFASNALTSEQNAFQSEQNALTSEQNALQSEQNALQSEQNAQAISDSILPQTGTLPVTYDVTYIYGDAGTPLTGNITDDQTGAVLGLVQKLYHQDATVPTFPATYVNIGAVGYVVNELNIIYIEYVSATRIEYWIAFEL
jgi:hypothetical protein